MDENTAWKIVGLVAGAIAGAYWRIWSLWQQLGEKADAKTVAAALEAIRNTESALNQRIERRVGRAEGDELWKQTNANRDMVASLNADMSGMEATSKATQQSIERIEKMVAQLLQEHRGGQQ